MQHPDITMIEMWGYPKYPDEIDEVDSLGNQLFKDDEVLMIEEEFFLINELTGREQKILEMLGAERVTI